MADTGCGQPEFHIVVRRPGRGPLAPYRLTIVVAFITLIHERMAQDLIARDLSDPLLLDWSRFAALHPDLFARDLLARYYAGEELKTELARRCFVLPRPAPPAPTSSQPGHRPAAGR